MVEYPNALKDDYRVGRITQTHPDSSGLVRTVTVEYRKRDVREDPMVYKSKPLVKEEMSVQRLVLLVPIAEQNLMS